MSECLNHTLSLLITINKNLSGIMEISSPLKVDNYTKLKDYEVYWISLQEVSMHKQGHTQIPDQGQVNPTARLVLGMALSFLSGLMMTAAFAPYDVWPLVFIVFIPLVLAQYRIMPAKYSSLAPAIMIATWLFLYFGPSFFTGGIMLALPVFGFIINLLAEKKNRTFHDETKYRWFIINGVVSWVGFELIRTFIPGIATWGFINYTLWSQPWLIQPVSVFSIYGLSMLILFINYALAQFSLIVFDRYIQWDVTTQISLHATRRWLIGIGVASIIWVSLSLIQFTSSPRDPETLRVAAIQLGETEVAFSHPDMDARTRLERLSDLTREAADQGARLISWSELALPFDPLQEYTEELRSLAEETDAYLVLPYGVFEEQGIRNEVVTLSPDGMFSESYAKAHPVLFASEPYGQNVGTYPVFETLVGVLASIICYDLNYTDVTRIMARQGAQIISAPSSDWPGIAEKQNVHLVFRAIETRTSILNAEKAFDSAIVDPYGRILEQSISLEPRQAILIADVPLGENNTLYLVLGDWLGWVALAGMLFFIVFSKRLVGLAKKS